MTLLSRGVDGAMRLLAASPVVLGHVHGDRGQRHGKERADQSDDGCAAFCPTQPYLRGRTCGAGWSMARALSALDGGRSVCIVAGTRLPARSHRTPRPGRNDDAEPEGDGDRLQP